MFGVVLDGFCWFCGYVVLFCLGLFSVVICGWFLFFCLCVAFVAVWCHGCVGFCGVAELGVVWFGFVLVSFFLFFRLLIFVFLLVWLGCSWIHFFGLRCFCFGREFIGCFLGFGFGSVFIIFVWFGDFMIWVFVLGVCCSFLVFCIGMGRFGVRGVG